MVQLTSIKKGDKTHSILKKCLLKTIDTMVCEIVLSIIHWNQINNITYFDCQGVNTIDFKLCCSHAKLNLTLWHWCQTYCPRKFWKKYASSWLKFLINSSVHCFLCNVSRVMQRCSLQWNSQHTLLPLLALFNYDHYSVTWRSIRLTLTIQNLSVWRLVVALRFFSIYEAESSEGISWLYTAAITDCSPTHDLMSVLDNTEIFPKLFNI